MRTLNQPTARPHLPAWLVKRVTDYGGLAPGGTPNFRIIWSQDRTCLVGGEWTDRDNSGNVIRRVVEMRRVPKYPQVLNRWLFEMWAAPEEFGSPEEWYRNTTQWVGGHPVPVLGPYPSEGEYELVKVLETPRRVVNGQIVGGEFVPLTATICDAIIASAQASRHVPRARKLESLAEIRQREQERQENNWKDRLKELATAFDGNPHVIVPGDMTQHAIQSAKEKVTVCES